MREVYLYQTVHVLDGECLCLREHLAVLDRWSRTLFGCPGPQDAREVGTAVAAVVGREAPGSDRSKFVRLVLPASGSLRLEFEGVSLYRGYSFSSAGARRPCARKSYRRIRIRGSSIRTM